MGPLQLFVVRNQVRQKLREHGVSRSAINSVIDSVDEDSVAVAAESASVSMSAMPVGKLGDGTILNAIMDFLKSPQGQALIDALMKMLLGLLGV